MSYAEMTLPEFEHEMAAARNVLECLPDDKFEWRAHPKLNTIGWNANHIAEIPGWVQGVLAAPTFDIAPVGGERYQSPKLKTRKEILELFDRNVTSAKKAIATVKDADMGQMWSLVEGGKPMITMPKAAVIRGFILSHLIHHRAFLTAYLRMNDIAVPGAYGPSG